MTVILFTDFIPESSLSRTVKKPFQNHQMTWVSQDFLRWEITFQKKQDVLVLSFKDKWLVHIGNKSPYSRNCRWIERVGRHIKSEAKVHHWHLHTTHSTAYADGYLLCNTIIQRAIKWQKSSAFHHLQQTEHKAKKNSGLHNNIRHTNPYWTFADESHVSPQSHYHTTKMWNLTGKWNTTSQLKLLQPKVIKHSTRHTRMWVKKLARDILNSKCVTHNQIYGFINFDSNLGKYCFCIPWIN
jgi:hypothetical protein